MPELPLGTTAKIVQQGTKSEGRHAANLKPGGSIARVKTRTIIRSKEGRVELGESINSNNICTQQVFDPQIMRNDKLSKYQHGPKPWMYKGGTLQQEKINAKAKIAQARSKDSLMQNIQLKRKLKFEVDKMTNERRIDVKKSLNSVGFRKGTSVSSNRGLAQKIKSPKHVSQLEGFLNRDANQKSQIAIELQNRFQNKYRKERISTPNQAMLCHLL